MLLVKGVSHMSYRCIIPYVMLILLSLSNTNYIFGDDNVVFYGDVTSVLIYKFKYLNNTLRSLLGTKLLVLYTGFVYHGTCGLYDTWLNIRPSIIDVVPSILSFIEGKAIDKILGSETSKLLMDKYTGSCILLTNYTVLNASYITLDIGYIYYRRGNGYVNVLGSIPNKTIGKIIDSFESDWNFYIPLKVKVVYAGIDAEEKEYVTRQEYIQLPNGTIIKKKPEKIVKLKNPYYKFYMLINGIRIRYPIKIGVEDQDGKNVVKFIELFLPVIDLSRPNRYTVFKIDQKYIDEIVEAVKNAVKDTINTSKVTVDNLIIKDIYYVATDNFTRFTPLVHLYIRGTNTVVTLLLYPDHVETLTTYVVGGVNSLSGLSDPRVGLYKLIKPYEEQIRVTENQHRYLPGLINMTILILIVTISIISASIIIFFVRKKRFFRYSSSYFSTYS